MLGHAEQRAGEDGDGIALGGRDRRMTSLAADHEAEALEGLLRDAQADRFDARGIGGRVDRSAFVERQLRVEKILAVLHEPAHAGGPARLLAGGEGDDEIARERLLRSRLLERDGDEGGGHRLVVAHAARV